MKLYKFRAVNENSLKGLRNNEIFFAGFELFNDPFEFSTPFTNLREYFRRVHLQLQDRYLLGHIDKSTLDHLLEKTRNMDDQKLQRHKQVHEKIRQNMSRMGIFSMSAVKDEILLWSHYAEEHKGFCIEFDVPRMNLSVPASLREIKYKEEFTDLNDPSLLVDFYVKLFGELSHLKKKKWRSRYTKSGQEMVKNEDAAFGLAVITDKYTCWSYEKEFRLVTKNHIGTATYDPVAVVTIILGLRMPDKHKMMLKEVCTCTGKTHVKFMQAVKKKNRFGIDIIEA